MWVELWEQELTRGMPLFLHQGNNFRFVIYPCGQKGVGLKSLDPIKDDQFVVEFVGEIVDKKLFNRRVSQYIKNNLKHSYIMAVKSKYFIDSTQVGGVARFINHSCSPNLVSRKWSVGGYTRIGFFALKDIPSDTELTFDYKFERFGDPIKCLCGSPKCMGFMGKPSSNTATVAPSPTVQPASSSNFSRSRPRNPETFIKYMIQLSEWGRRFKVIMFLKVNALVHSGIQRF